MFTFPSVDKGRSSTAGRTKYNSITLRFGAKQCLARERSGSLILYIEDMHAGWGCVLTAEDPPPRCITNALGFPLYELAPTVVFPCVPLYIATNTEREWATTTLILRTSP
jgi:hypothetical protein